MSIPGIPTSLEADYFFTLFDEFKCVPIAKVNAYITIASSLVSKPAWGCQATYATALLTAHLLASTGGVGGSGGGAGGAITSESVGEESRSYGTVGTPDSSDAQLNTTRYGQEYVLLRNMTIMPGFISQSGPPTTPFGFGGGGCGFGGGFGF